ncbi:hypothetical protein chiPu_0028610, partial [Chiloscyllium punctatum]|nr:hypothetical protein [Chiloscyllium punctatum]
MNPHLDSFGELVGIEMMALTGAVPGVCQAGGHRSHAKDPHITGPWGYSSELPVVLETETPGLGHPLDPVWDRCYHQSAPPHRCPTVGEAAPAPPREIDTHEVAGQVTAELKRCGIPQAVFARAVLGRSQGTLSDLLRRPKPWHRLKSGRETFRTMWTWLREPESQRITTLRMEGGHHFTILCPRLTFPPYPAHPWALRDN